MTIISFPTECVVIWTAPVSEARREERFGVVFRRHDPPTHRYFVDFVERDGSTLGAWDGDTYDAALLAAQEWGVRIVDETSETRGRA